MKINELKGKEVSRKATVEKQSLIDEQKRMIPFILISADNAGERWCCGDIDYIEKLDVSGAKWDNLKTFFKDHNASVDSAIGRVENVRVDKGQLKADVYFGSNKEALEVFEKYKEGILTDVSIRYRVEAATIEEKQGEPDVITITSFDIKEVSAVGIGFDKNATVGRSGETNFEGSSMKTDEMKKKIEELSKLTKRNAEQEQELKDLKQKIEASEQKEAADIAELKRQNELKDIALQFNVDGETLRSFIDDKTKDSKALMQTILQRQKEGQGMVYAGKNSEMTRANKIDAMADGLLARYGFDTKDKHTDADMFRNMGVKNIVREVAGLGLGASDNELVRAMTTSDFPLILSNIQNKMLQREFETAPVTFRDWVVTDYLPNLKLQTELSISGDYSNYKKTAELGKGDQSQGEESGVTWKLNTYKKSVSFTRELLINDDMGVFLKELSKYINGAFVFQNRQVYDLLQQKGEFKDYKWVDDKPIFDATHKNFDATGSDITTDSIAEARVAMSRQKDGKTNLRILPRHIIVPPELEIKALEILNSTAKVEASNSGVANPFKSAFSLISEVELEDAKAWYLAAQYRTIKVGYLEGSNQMPIVETVNQNSSGIDIDILFDFGLTFEDYRGIYKNIGA